MNHKRLFRIYRAAGLSGRRKKRKRLMRVGQPLFTATRPNQQWAIDIRAGLDGKRSNHTHLEHYRYVHSRVPCLRSRYLLTQSTSYASA